MTFAHGSDLASAKRKQIMAKDRVRRGEWSRVRRWARVRKPRPPRVRAVGAAAVAQAVAVAGSAWRRRGRSARRRCEGALCLRVRPGKAWGEAPRGAAGVAPDAAA